MRTALYSTLRHLASYNDKEKHPLNGQKRRTGPDSCWTDVRLDCDGLERGGAKRARHEDRDRERETDTDIQTQREALVWHCSGDYFKTVQESHRRNTSYSVTYHITMTL